MNNINKGKKMEIKQDSSQNDEILQKIKDLKSQLPKKERKPKKLPIALTEDEFINLLKSTKSDKHKLAFMLGWAGGLRVSEVVKLQPSDIQNGTILIRMGKGSKDRIAPLPKTFQAKHLKMFPLGIGVRALQKAFKNSAETSGLLKVKPTAHFHSLRHGFATHFIEQGGAVELLQGLMGHTNIATTNIYMHLNPKFALDKYKEIF
jgi:integrase/recombinase XerD